ncbi:MAG: glycosyl hydrolase family 28-related protein [Mucilaginibacter sp.]|uniref:glycosyl hydrolase family 28-related protein n=1 Tax=Mucilaginibacter sp. TaxID=1882438 RepID=UPI0031A695A5
MIFQTISDLRTTVGTIDTTADVLGYYSPGDGGGGHFYWDNSSNEQDNNGTIFSTGSIGRWKRLYSGEINVKWFAARGDNTSDNYPAFSAVSDFLSNSPYGGTMYIPEGSYLLETGVEFNQLVGDESAIRRISVNGSGMGSTEIIYNGTGNALRFYSQFPGALVQNYSLSNFKLTKKAALYQGTGVKIEYSAFMEMHNVRINLFEQGMLTDNFLGAGFYTCIVSQNNYGMVMQGQTLPPNDINFYGCTFSSNKTLALSVTGGVLLNIFGGDIEGNGWESTAVRKGGLMIDAGTTSIGGSISANIHGVYFEGNGGLADIMYYAGNGAGLSILNVYGSTFNRIYSIPNQYVTNNIVGQLGALADSPVKINVRDCGFRSFNSYQPDSARKYINVASDGAKYNVSDEGCAYMDIAEKPIFKGINIRDNNKITTGVVFRGTDGSIINSLGNVLQILKNGIGDYTVLFEQSYATPWYFPSFSTGESTIIYAFSAFTDRLRLKSEDRNGNPQDPATIYVTICGGQET